MMRKATKKMGITGLLCFVTAIFITGMTAKVDAQYYTTNATQGYNNSYYLVEKYSEHISELSKVISVKAKKAPIRDILEEIAHKANLGIAYNAELGFLDNQIDVNLHKTTVGNTLQRVLSNTGYRAAISRTREIVFIKRPPLPKVSKKITDKQLTGTVVNVENGKPLPGVNVVVKGTTNGTSTDENGRFSLTVADDAQALVFSFVGFKKQEVPIGDQTEFNIKLQPDIESLQDVIVVGYGTQQKTDVTGSISSVGSDKLENVPVTSFENAIQGQIAGVNVEETTGEPGATPQIKIRGTGSISAGNSPLYVIDGLPISKNTNLQGDLFRRRAAFTPPKANPLATLNPGDIQSIEVLKDASASAIYGSRGSNGVILITTKKGAKRGGTRINFSAYAGVQNAMNVPDMMNSEEIIAYTKDSRNNYYLQEYNPTDPTSPDYNPNYSPDNNNGRPDDDFALIPEKYVNWNGTDTDWLDLVLSPASLSNYDLSVAGGTEDITYYLSGGYFNQNGIIDGSGFDRYTLKANLVADLSDKFQVGANINGAFTKHDRLPASAPYFARPPGIVYSAMVHSPVLKPYNSDGEPNQLDGQSYLGGGTTSASNPLAIMQAVSDNIDNNRLFGNLFAQFNISSDLYFKTFLGADLDSYQRTFYRGNTLLYRTATEGEPYAQQSSAEGLNWVWENTLNYSTAFGEDHQLTALIGYTAQKETDKQNSVIAQNFPDDQVKTVNGGVIVGGSGLEEEWSLVSMLARVNYSYKDRYLLTGTIRSDRSSRFGPDNQTGIFPSVSVGWRLANEPFMQSMDFLSELKLRASYGLTGNFLIPNYGSVGLLGESNYILNGQEVSGLGPSTLGNSELSWETTRQLDLGIDFSFLNDRIYGATDYYYSKTKDLLLEVTIPSALGFQTALTNIGEVANEGFEFSITSRNLVGDFQWSTDINFSTNRNEVLKLGPEGDAILSAGAAGIRHITRVGDPIGSYYGYVVDGVYQSQEEIDNSPTDTQAPDPRPGDFKFKDIDGDGQITPDDRTVTG
ncbi:MAG: TonB-dependent receptor, partial [Balneolaceae bacterium]